MYPARELRELCACRACASNSMTLALATCEVTKERGLKTADFRAVKDHGASLCSRYGRLLRGRPYMKLLLGGMGFALGREAVVGPGLLMGRCGSDVRC